MGVFSEYDATLQEVSRVMQDQPAETQLEYKLDRMITELDELCGMANKNPSDLERHLIAIGQMKTRIDLVCGFLMARKSNMRIVGRG